MTQIVDGKRRQSDDRFQIADCRFEIADRSIRAHRFAVLELCNLHLPQICHESSNLLTVSLPLGPRELAVMPAVENIDQHAEPQPDDEAQPGDDRQPGHQPAAQHHRDQREPGNEGNTEGALTIRLPPPQKDNSQRNQNKSEQCADIGKIGRVSDIHQSRPEFPPQSRQSRWTSAAS